MGEIVKRNDQTPEVKKEGSPKKPRKILRINDKTDGVDFSGAINRVFQYVNIADIVAKVQTGVEYIVQVPAEFQIGYDAGDYFMMEGKTSGKMWPTLMRIAESGKQEIVTPLPIKPNVVVQGNPIQELSLGCHNLYMQKQMQQLSDAIQDTLTIVKRIEKGQQTDRIGLMESGKMQILLALQRRGQDGWKQDLANGRKSLSDARGQFLAAFRERVKEFEPVPKSVFMQLLREFASTGGGYGDKKDDEYSELSTYFNLLLESTQLLSASYAVVGDLATAERVYDLTQADLNAIDFSGVNTIKYLHRKSDFESFGTSIPQYIETDCQECLEKSEKYDTIEIEITGEKLLEVLNFGDSEEVQE